MNAETRPMYWSVLRELWENRSIYMAPVVVAAVVLFGFLISTMTLPRRMKAVSALSPAKQLEKVNMPFNVVAGLVVVTAFIVGVFYCLDALYGERRDRSILFWKSLPVSDRTTVLAKASIPLVVLPLLNFMIIVTTQLVMLLASTIVLLGNQAALATLWTNMKVFQLAVAVLYGLIAIALWHAPVYAWLLLVSAWARRATVLWALLPILAIGALEAMAFRTSHFMRFVGYRLTGWFQQAFDVLPKGSKDALDPLAALTPGKFLLTPGLWIGLAFAAAFLAAAVRLRRNREPI
jgi:ABC-2 type transport system permease protein